MWDRVRVNGGTTVVGTRGVPLAEVAARLDAGGAPAEVTRTLKLDAADLIAALGAIALEGDGPALVQEPPPRPGFLIPLSEPAWAELLPGAARPARLALAAGLLQVHDFWEASHAAAQESDDQGERPFSAYWHGIAHRREPDPGNAAYWFRRVGRHPLFVPLAAAARPLLDAHGDPTLTARFLPQGTWNALAFIDLCTGGGSGRVTDLARSLQKLELRILLAATAAAVLPAAAS